MELELGPFCVLFGPNAAGKSNFLDALQLLREAVAQAGVVPLLGGIEYAEDLVNELDLMRARKADKAFDKAVDDLQTVLKQWARA